MKWYLDVLKKYVVFSGRARRKEYWMFTLFQLIFLLVAALLDNIIGTAIAGVGYGLFYFVYAIATFLPSLAVGVRRLHDTGRSGWMLLLGLIPILNIWLLVLMIIEGNAGENEYGPDPKGQASASNETLDGHLA